MVSRMRAWGRIHGTLDSEKAGQRCTEHWTVLQAAGGREPGLWWLLKVQSCLRLRAVGKTVCPLTAWNPSPEPQSPHSRCGRRSVRKSVPPRRGAEVPPRGTVIADRGAVMLVTSLPGDAREFSRFFSRVHRGSSFWPEAGLSLGLQNCTDGRRAPWYLWHWSREGAGAWEGTPRRVRPTPKTRFLSQRN